MNEQKFPWAMDKPIEELSDYMIVNHVHDDFTNYLLARLKKAESERDERYTNAATSVIREEQERHAAEMQEVLEAMEKQYQDGGLYTGLVTILDKYRHYLEEK